jgi:hypothetical protein
MAIFRSAVSSQAKRAQVAELVDALGSGPSGGNTVEVRVLSWAPSVLKRSALCRPFFISGPGSKAPARFARGLERPRANPWRINPSPRPTLTAPQNTAIRIAQINASGTFARSSRHRAPTSSSTTPSRTNTGLHLRPTDERSARISGFQHFFGEASETY